jgi:hypothetical protein
MGNQNKRTVDIGQTNQIAEWRESNNAWSATSFLSKNKTRSVNEPRSSGSLRISDMTLMGLCPLLGGEFNRSTQHYSPERSGHGAGAIPPLRAKILHTALVPRALGRRLPPIGRSSSALRLCLQLRRETTSVHAPPYAYRSNVPDRVEGCCVDRLNPPHKADIPTGSTDVRYWG